MKVAYTLDCLKPHIPDSSFLALELKSLEGVSYVQIKVDEIDQKTTSVFIRIKGVDVKLEDITAKLESLNCALHSVDEVSIQDEES